VQAKAPNAAEQIPHMLDGSARTQSRAVAYSTGHGRVGLEEALRADPQRHAVEVFRQRLLFGEEDLSPLP
jgi:hypothetical protein